MITIVVLGVGTAHAGCDVAGVGRMVEAIEHVADEHRSLVAAAGLAEACTKPAGLSSGAADLARVPPEMRPMIDLKVASDEPMAWMAVCSGGLQPLADMVALAPADKRDHLWTACDLERHGWLTREQFDDADGAIVIALIGGQTLADSGVPADQVGTVVRALAGVGLSATSTDAVANLWSDEALGLGNLDGALVGAPAGGDKPDFTPTGRVEPTWSKQASRRGGSCLVAIQVRADSALKGFGFVECDKALQDDVRAAIEASAFQARTKDGAPAAGRFRVTYPVE